MQRSEHENAVKFYTTLTRIYSGFMSDLFRFYETRGHIPEGRWTGEEKTCKCIDADLSGFMSDLCRIYTPKKRLPVERHEK